MQSLWIRVLYILLIVAFLLVPLIVLPQEWKILSALAAVAAALGGNLLANVIQGWCDPHTPAAIRDARRQYLVKLRDFCQVLPLAPLDEDQEFNKAPTLEQVYIDLDTMTPIKGEEADPNQEPNLSFGRAETSTATKWLSAQEAVTQHHWLVLLGDPGAGKSSFVRQLVANMATALLAEKAFPGLPADHLPVLMTLRDLAARLDPINLARHSEEDRRLPLARAIRDQALADLTKWEAAAFENDLHDLLESGRCILILDGLDEVPPQLRQYVREAVRAVLVTYPIPQVIVTCRVRSYVGEAVLPDFQAHRLAPFNEDKIRAFVEAWYAAQQQLDRVPAEQVKSKTDDLTQAAIQDQLRELAKNPMLLTTMAMIHQRNIGLPSERVKLYDQAVELVLRRWERYRRGETGLTPDPELAIILEDDQKVRQVTEALAYEAHRTQQGGTTGEDLPRGTALTLLEKPAYLKQLSLAEKFLDYVDQRAGLLVGLGGEPGRPDAYRFPHRTFQEYLAACHLVCQWDAPRAFWAHTDDGDYWSQVVQLGAEELRYNRPRTHELLRLAYSLCQGTEPTQIRDQRAALWSGIMAAQAGKDEVADDVTGGDDYLKRLRPSLLACVRGTLTAPERAEAGNALAQFDDPRFNPNMWSLLDDPQLGFVEIPQGQFTMGSAESESFLTLAKESPDFQLILPTYYIARYPVTVAQFRIFVSDQNDESINERCLEGLSNHPVVWVRWKDAMAYCDWLTARLKSRLNELPEPMAKMLGEPGGRIILPSEAEWEKAARGLDGRLYPWGNETDQNRANTVETRIHRTSPVGCFPQGASLPYGVEELSGNVWEWTRSVLADYPYPNDSQDCATRETLQSDGVESRVLRGGAFDLNASGVRCAFRGRDGARYGNYYIGFRVVLSTLP